MPASLRTAASVRPRRSTNIPQRKSTVDLRCGILPHAQNPCKTALCEGLFGMLLLVAGNSGGIRG